MKKYWWYFLGCLLAVVFLQIISCNTTGTSTKEAVLQNNITSGTVILDEAIKLAAENIENNVEQGFSIALLNFDSPSEIFSEYIIERLTDRLVYGKKLIVVNRNELELIRQEEEFQMSGEVSEESAQSIGKKLGAQVIVSGSLTSLERIYLFRIKVLIVETAATIASLTYDLNPNEERIQYLLAATRSVLVDSNASQLQQQIPDGIEFEIIDGRSITITGYHNTGYDEILIIPERIQGLPVTAIRNSVFQGYSLISITIPSSVTSIGDNTFSDDVYGSSRLMIITVDSRNPAYSSIDGVLFDKNLSTIISYPPRKKSGAYVIPSSVTTIGNFAFYGSNLTNITIPSSATIIGNLSFAMSDLVNINIPLSLTNIGENAFLNCNNLTSITVDDRNPSYTSIDGALFDKNIRRIITYPAGKRTEIYSIPSSVTILEAHAFHGSSNLTRITIPSSVTQIGNYAFLNCINLTSVNLSRRTQIGEDVFPLTNRIVYLD
jgi:TolB-like protein